MQSCSRILLVKILVKDSQEKVSFGLLSSQVRPFTKYIFQVAGVNVDGTGVFSEIPINILLASTHFAGGEEAPLG